MKFLWAIVLVIMLSLRLVADNNSLGTKDPISLFIGTSFIEGYEKRIRNNVYLLSERRSLSMKECIKTGIEKGWCCSSVELHDVKIMATIDTQKDKRFFIISTEVYGSPEDFMKENILENEKDLLKNILIQAYFDKDQSGPNQHMQSFPIDRDTKVTLRPEFLITSLKNGFSVSESYTKTRKGMKFVTIFSENDFDHLIMGCFPKSTQTDNPFLKNFLIGTIAFGGVGSIVLYLLIKHYSASILSGYEYGKADNALELARDSSNRHLMRYEPSEGDGYGA